MRALLTLLLPSVVLAALAAWLVVLCPHHAAGCCGADRTACGSVAQLDKAVGLTPDQRTAAAGELAGYQRELVACSTRLAETRQRLAKQLFQPGVGDDALQAMAGDLGRIQRESDLATLRHMRRMHALLRPEQQARYAAWLQPCLCGGRTSVGESCSCETTNRP